MRDTSHPIDTFELNDDFLTPAVVELLQLAQTGCLKTVSSLRDDNIQVSFSLQHPNDPALPFTSLSHHTSVHFQFGQAYPVTRMAAAVLGRRGLIEMMWHGTEFPLWQENSLGWAAVTKQGRRVLAGFWSFFDAQARDWTDSGTTSVKASWLVPGNIVHHPYAKSRFQVHDAAGHDTLIQITTDTRGGFEYFTPHDLVTVETGSLLPGQRYLPAPVPETQI